MNVAHGSSLPNGDRAGCATLRQAWPPQDARGKEYDGADKFQCPAHSNADQAKWKQEQPNNRVKHQRQNRERPAQHEQNAPKQEFDHDCILERGPLPTQLLNSIINTRPAALVFHRASRLYAQISGSVISSWLARGGRRKPLRPPDRCACRQTCTCAPLTQAPPHAKFRPCLENCFRRLRIDGLLWR